MQITQWADRVKSLPSYLSKETNPYSLPVILKIDPDVVLTHEQVLEATVQTFAHFFNNDNVASEDSHWFEPLNIWMQGRIRKVSRRAKPGPWYKIRQELKHYYHQHNNVEMIILPPHPLDEIPLMVKKLQVSGLDLEQTKQFNSPIQENMPIFNIATNPNIVMTTGKSIAQVAHATQVNILTSKPEMLKAWVANKYATQFTNWNSPMLLNSIEIQDAGFTEIEPGTLTVKANLC